MALEPIALLLSTHRHSLAQTRPPYCLCLTVFCGSLCHPPPGLFVGYLTFGVKQGYSWYAQSTCHLLSSVPGTGRETLSTTPAGLSLARACSQGLRVAYL